ncbi:MAG: chromatin protein Cren7 [Ignisphaera sp.]|jgi:hypothetical protein|nr:chromatin protein Cren7 [Ignisphaera sp.]
MPCSTSVKVKDPTTHLEIVATPEKVFVIRNRGKEIKIGLFTSPKTGLKFRALLPPTYPCQE